MVGGAGAQWSLARTHDTGPAGGDMCETLGDEAGELVQAVAPRPAPGPAVDPIALEPVDELVVLMLVDNSFYALLPDLGPARRTTFMKAGRVSADQFVDGMTVPGLIAEHGFSALVRVRRGGTT